MSGSLKNVKTKAEQTARDIVGMVYQSMDESLSMIAGTATGKYMIQTGTGAGSKLDRVTRAVDNARLTVRTGELVRSLIRKDHPKSIRQIVTEGVQTRGSVGSSVAYARIHEMGGRTSPHVIVPKKGKYLHFMIGEKHIFARSVNHPGSVIPARPYLKPTLEDPGVQESIKKQLGNEFLLFVRDRMKEALAQG